MALTPTAQQRASERARQRAGDECAPGSRVARRHLELAGPHDRDAAETDQRPPDTVTRHSLALFDCLALAVAFGVAELVVTPALGGFTTMLLSALTLPAWVLIFKLYGLYDRDAKRISHSTLDDLPHLLNALIVGSLGVWVYSKLVFPERLQLAQGVAFFAVALAGILIGRALVRGVVAPRIARERVVLVGNGRMAEVLLRKVRQHPEYGLDPVGYLAADGRVGRLDGLPHLGDPRTDLSRACKSVAAHRVVVAAAGMSNETLVETVRRCSGLNLKVGVVPDLVEVLGSSVETDDLEGVAVLGLSPPVFSRSSRWLKRSMDVVVASTALFCAAPLMLLVAIAIKLTSRGPVLFSQERIGQQGHHFRMHKFRTMVKDAEGQEAELKRHSRHSAWLFLDHDPRITRVGKVLRYTSIDELPQLFNVLRGDMSLVGPRPVTPEVDEHISGWGRRRLDLTPGITGLWQALGRTTIPFEEMVNLDYLYVTNWSLWTDLRLLVRTVPTVLRQRGVN